MHIEDMRDSVERLGMQRKEKSLAAVSGPCTDYKAGDTVEITSNKGRRWVWRVVDGLEALGSWLGVCGCSEAGHWHKNRKKPVPCSITQRNPCCAIPRFRSRGAYMPSTPRVWLLHCTVLATGHIRSLCFRRCVFRSWANSDVFYGCAGRQTRLGVDYMKRTGPLVARQLKKHGQPRFQTLAMRRGQQAACVNGTLS